MKKNFAFLFSLILCLLITGCSFSDPAKEIQEAEKSAKKGDWAMALTIMEHCQQVIPKDADALALKALTTFKNSPSDALKLEQVITELKQAEELKKERYDIFFIHGWILMRAGKYQEALAPLEAAYTLHMNEKNRTQVQQNVEGAILLCLAECSRQNNLLDQALERYEQATRLEPYGKWAEIYNNMGTIYIQQQNYYKAMEILNKKALKLDSQSPEITANLAIAIDHLSNPLFNKNNYSSFAKSRLSWYQFARKNCSKRLEECKDEEKLAFYKDLYTKLNTRIQELQAAP